MKIVDLTLPIGAAPRLEEKEITHGSSRYTGLTYHFAHHSMEGTYIDLPGHIKETDDGQDAAGYPPEKLFRVESLVIHLDRENNSGGVTAAELSAACRTGKKKFGGVVINALGKKQFHEIDYRSVWLARDATQWIIDTGAHLLISDIYECCNLLGIFYDLFKAGVSTVCNPVNLYRIRSDVALVTVLMPRFQGVTQLPCRILAEY